MGGPQPGKRPCRCSPGMVDGGAGKSHRDALKDFEGVEHRLEYVDTVNGVVYINDSKGTNPDASARAVKAMDRPIVLIAEDTTRADFDEFVDGFDDKVKGVVLFGSYGGKLNAHAGGLI